jgi:hypothetical protein
MKRVFLPALLVLLFLSALSPAFAAGAQLTLDVGSTSSHVVGAQMEIDGQLYNSDPVYPCTDVLVTITFHNSAGGVLGTFREPADCHVLDHSGTDMTTFSWVGTRPTGTDHWHVSASGVAIGPSNTPLVIAMTGDVLETTDADGHRHYAGDLPNTEAFPITSVIPCGSEVQGLTQGTASFMDAFHDRNSLAMVLQPGSDDLTFDLQGTFPKVSTPGYSIWRYLYASAVRYTPSTVYRFYHRQNGTHFYTASEAEKNNVQNTLSGTYAYEGPAYGVNTASPSNMRPLYRFYNRRNGTHFYTASEAEKNNVQNTLSGTYAYDGPAYKVSTFPWYSRPVYRFYNKAAGTHFYTASEAEKANVIATLGSIYTYEGPAFYLAY